MFVHLGEDTVILKRNIIAILNLESVDSNITKEFIKDKEKRDVIKYVSKKENQSAILVKNEEYTLYYSPISVATLRKRSIDKNE